MEETLEPKGWIKYVLGISGTVLFVALSARVAYVDREIADIRNELRGEQKTNVETRERMMRMETQLQTAKERLNGFEKQLEQRR